MLIFTGKLESVMQFFKEHPDHTLVTANVMPDKADYSLCVVVDKSLVWSPTNYVVKHYVHPVGQRVFELKELGFQPICVLPYTMKGAICYIVIGSQSGSQTAPAPATLPAPESAPAVAAAPITPPRDAEPKPELRLPDAPTPAPLVAAAVPAPMPVVPLAEPPAESPARSVSMFPAGQTTEMIKELSGTADRHDAERRGRKKG